MLHINSNIIMVVILDLMVSEVMQVLLVSNRDNIRIRFIEYDCFLIYIFIFRIYVYGVLGFWEQ